MLKRQTENHPFDWRSITRITAAVIGLFVCVWMTVGAAKVGISRLLADYGFRASVPAAADRAVSFGPYDPQVRYFRAGLLSSAGEFTAAAQELSRAVTIRPRDHFLWVELGLTRDLAGDAEGAIAAFKQATLLAPYYAQPRWQLGNALFRAGQHAEAFAELRGAVASNPTLLPNTIDLAYGLYGGDTTAVEQAVQPQTPAARFALARFFAKSGKSADALRLFRASGQISDEERQNLVTDFLSAQQFPAAYEVWASGADKNRRGYPSAGQASIVDGGFEEEIRAGAAPSFGWRIERSQVIKASLSRRDPHSGSRSLLIEWNGDPQPWASAASQLILVAPNKSYRLSFWARAEDLVTAGSPIVLVSASGKTERLLTYSPPLAQTASDWRQYSLQFQTDADTQAITLTVRREECSARPCPIFGRLWFDDFTLSNP